MTHDRCHVYMWDGSFDVRDTHTLNFIRKYHYEVCLLTQTVDPPPLVPTKGNLKTFDYPSMPSSSMHTSAARNVIVFSLIRTSNLLSQVGYVSKLSRLYLGERPRRCTMTPSDRLGGFFYLF